MGWPERGSGARAEDVERDVGTPGRCAVPILVHVQRGRPALSRERPLEAAPEGQVAPAGGTLPGQRPDVDRHPGLRRPRAERLDEVPRADVAVREDGEVDGVAGKAVSDLRGRGQDDIEIVEGRVGQPVVDVAVDDRGRHQVPGHAPATDPGRDKHRDIVPGETADRALGRRRDPHLPRRDAECLEAVDVRRSPTIVGGRGHDRHARGPAARRQAEGIQEGAPELGWGYRQGQVDRVDILVRPTCRRGST